MKWMSLLSCRLLIGVCVFAAENDSHQRVGVLEKTDQRWESTLQLSLQPWDSTWLVSLAPQLSYEYLGSYALSVSAPFLWTAQPRLPQIRSRWGDLEAFASWRATTGEPRWRVSAGIARPLSAGSGPIPIKAMGEVGTSLVRDPLILSLSLQGSVDLPPKKANPPSLPWQGGVRLSIQEVVNEASVSLLSMAAHWNVEGPYPLWAVSVSWGFAWSESPMSATSSVAVGSGEPWTWTGSVGRSW